MSSQAIIWGDKTTGDQNRAIWESPANTYDTSDGPGFQPARVTRREGVWGGMATVAESRVPVFMVADLEAAGESVDEIRQRYPHLTRADIYAALSYAHTYEGVISEERARYMRIVEQYKR